MTKFFVMLGLLALVVSCGQQELPEEEPGTIGSRFELSDIKTFDSKEVSSIKEACASLLAKEKAYSSQYAGKGVIFDFTSERLACGKTTPVKYKTGAKIEYRNGKMFFEKLASNAIIFDDIVLRSYGPLKEFCDRADAGALNKRYISSGKMVSIVYAVGKGPRILLAVETANSYAADGEYITQSNDKFLIDNSASKYQGFVIKRSIESTAGCSGTAVTRLTTNLVKVH